MIRKIKGKTNSEGEYQKKISNHAPKKNKPKKKYKKNKNNNLNNENKEIDFENNRDLPFTEYIEKEVLGDGNCYYRVLSYYFRQSKEFHSEFRKLIYELFINNLDKFIDFVPDHTELKCQNLKQRKIF